MNSEYGFVWTLGLFCVGALIAFIVTGITNCENGSKWAAKCEQAGGIASEYRVLRGKVSESERLCIKREQVIEVQ